MEQEELRAHDAEMALITQALTGRLTT